MSLATESGLIEASGAGTESALGTPARLYNRLDEVIAALPDRDLQIRTVTIYRAVKDGQEWKLQPSRKLELPVTRVNRFTGKGNVSAGQINFNQLDDLANLNGPGVQIRDEQVIALANRLMNQQYTDANAARMMARCVSRALAARAGCVIDAVRELAAP